MSDYAEWDAASVDLASEIVKGQLDPLYVGERLTVVFEAIGDDKVRVNASSWSDAVVIRAEEALEVLAIGKRLPRRAAGELPQPRHDRDDGRRLRAGYEVTRNVPL